MVYFLLRFEQEISNSNRPVNMFVPSQLKHVIGSNAYNQMNHKMNHQHAPLIPPPLFNNTFQQLGNDQKFHPSPVILSSAPKLYSARAQTTTNVPTVELPTSMTSYNVEPSAAPSSSGFDMANVQFEVAPKIKKSKSEKSTPNPIAEDIIKAAKASSALQSFGNKDKKKLDKKTVRAAGGAAWEDNSLADWPDDDFRIFCGDLGNDVNDELLTRTFTKYPSFQKAKVVRDKRTSKSKGYGFISFKDPQDFIKAMKEMDGE